MGWAGLRSIANMFFKKIFEKGWPHISIFLYIWNDNTRKNIKSLFLIGV